MSSSTLPPDSRHIRHGRIIPTESYSDQPYVVTTDDGAWLCAVTTGGGEEGQCGQHVITQRSNNEGLTWSAPVDVEPGAGPEASYAVMAKAPSGRIFIFYNHNSDNIRRVRADDPPYPSGWCSRVDSLGYFVFKYSDDHGRNWSARRHPIPVREFAIDRANADGGRVRYFWNVGRPFVLDGALHVPLHKVGGFGVNFFTSSEGVLLRSTDVLTLTDPAQASWETLPEGEIGLRTPPGGGPIAEEHSFSILSDGTLFVVYRTTDGHPVCAYSSNGGSTWTAPTWMTYPDGRRLRHPRAANFAWRRRDGTYLYWFHHHGGRSYEGRNPVWLCGGREAATPDGRRLVWSPPEIFLYDDDPLIRMSYPDLIETPDQVFLTETQKDVARVHEVPPALLSVLRGELPATAASLLAAWQVGQATPAEAPPLPAFTTRDFHSADYRTKDLRQGFSLLLELYLASSAAGQVLLDTRRADGVGLVLTTTADASVELRLFDGGTYALWSADAGWLRPSVRHRLVAILDGGPKIMRFVVDGRFDDGGAQRAQGWGRFSPYLTDVTGTPTWLTAAGVSRWQVYGRALYTAEAVALTRADD
jgi:hypothetical protein